MMGKHGRGYCSFMLTEIYIYLCSKCKNQKGCIRSENGPPCEPDVLGNKGEFEPAVFPWTCCESLSEGVTAT